MINKQVIDLIGNTPLLRLKKASDETGCNIFGKAEFLNPGQSVKDRAALQIIKKAIVSKEIRPGGSIVEGTAGNTGIGLSLVASFYGFKSVIVIPETQTEEKKEAARRVREKEKEKEEREEERRRAQAQAEHTANVAWMSELTKAAEATQATEKERQKRAERERQKRAEQEASEREEQAEEAEKKQKEHMEHKRSSVC